MSKIFFNISQDNIDEYDDKVSSKKLKHYIEKAYCQCNWQRILPGVYDLALFVALIYLYLLLTAF